MIDLQILVEGHYDAVWLNILVHKAFARSDLRIATLACGGKKSVLNKFISLKDEPPQALEEQKIVVAVIDADKPSLADAREEIRSVLTLSHFADRIFFAVPSIESWLFADVDVAKRFLVRTDTAALDRIQFPDEIPLPKRFAQHVFGGNTGLKKAGVAIMQELRLDIAVSRSPSLRDFLSGLGNLLGETRYDDLPDAEKLLGRRLLGALIAEANPSTRVIYRTMAGESVTVSELVKQIISGTPLARQYAADLLRVARELLAQEAEQSGDSRSS